MQTPSIWRRTRLWAVLAIMMAALVGCDDDDAKVLDSDADGDVTESDADTSVEPDTTPDVSCTDECTTEGTTCDGTAVVVCTEGVDGCLDESSTDCADQDGTCVEADGTAMCQGTTTEMICDDEVDDDGDGDVDCDDADCADDPACIAEVCDNGTDDDGDDDVDCADDECDGVGICEAGTELTCDDGEDNDGDGLTDCADTDDCSGAANCMTPAEICDNGTDDDGDGMADCADADCMMFPACMVTPEICDNTLDDDGDGDADCADADCVAAVNCLPETACDDGNDNDGDGNTDCLDDDCDGVGTCEFLTEVTCDDGVDNDADNDTDCADSDCATDAACVESVCDDGVDNDADGDVDCADSDCASATICEATETTCDDGFDNDADGDADCADSDCIGMGACEQPEATCDDGVDNDGDGDTDCDDSDCAADGACVELVCNDGTDNDNDGDTDCADSDCATYFACGAEVCTDGFDNDADGMVDCADADCSSTVACTGGPVETLSGCDPTFCTLAVGAGPSGGDVCTCTIPGNTHPVVDDIEASCWGSLSDDSADLLVTIDLSGTTYTAIAATTCTSTAADSSVAIFDAADLTDNADFACAEDSQPTYCSEIPPVRTQGTSVVVAIDEWDIDDYWDDSTARIFSFELISAPATESTCDDGLDEDFDGDTDCADSDCVGVGACEQPEATCDDGTDNDGDGDVDCADSDCASATICEATELSCDDAFDNDGDGAVDCQDVDCVSATNCLSGLPQPGAGQLVITEIMYDSVAISDTNGEFIEIYNPTASDYDLQGCVLASGTLTSSFVLSLVVPAGGYVVLSNGAMPGFATDYEWFGFSLDNFGDDVRVECTGVVVDAVTYDDASPWPDPPGGVSIQLNPASSFDATINDDGANWCRSTATSANYTSGDVGTPRNANPACPPTNEMNCTDGVDEDFDGAADCLDPDGDCISDAACAATDPQPTIGGVVITEIMYNSNDPSDLSGGEWVELHNPGAATVDLQGCEFVSGTTRGLILESTPIPAGGYVIFAETASLAPTSTTPVYDWNFGLLLDDGDDVSLECAAGVIDVVVYDNIAPWPAISTTPPNPGVAIQLDPTRFDATSNDAADSWCYADSQNGITSTDLGTPGFANTACPREMACGDGTDNDGDGATDCADADCAGIGTCEQPETSCGDGNDNDGDGDTDCADSDCDGIGSCIETVCDDGTDNDGDGDTDCADSDCDMAANCQPVETLTGCDATYCTLTAGGGPNGGDVCECTIPAGNHPVTDDLEGSCFQNTAGMQDLQVIIDLAGTSYTDIAASTCPYGSADSSLALFDDIGDQMACNEDSNPGGFEYCAEIGPTPLNGATSVTLLVDEYGAASFWNQSTDRTFAFELITTAAEDCDNGTDDDGDGDIDCADLDCIADTACQATDPQPIVGQVVITEVMYDSADPGDTAGGEWIELHNPSGTDVDLQGCELVSGLASDLFVQSLVVPAGGYVLLAEDASATHISADYDWTAVTLLSDTGDSIAIECGTDVIDTITFDDAAPWPDPAQGIAIQLNTMSLDATANDDGANWCAANTQVNITSSDLGTPGAPNSPCTPPETACDDGTDNDGDGNIDCADSDCAMATSCQPIETFTGCDARFCTLTAGGGPNGGDLCECTLAGYNHPVTDDLEGSCFAIAGGQDLIVNIDLSGTPFTHVAATTCNGSTSADSSVAIFDGTGTELACNEDLNGSDYCGQVPPTAATGVVTVLIDEYSTGYWNQSSARTFAYELITVSATETDCADGNDNDADGDTDCADSDCSAETFCEATEMTCDDGFDNDGDGDADCDDSDCDSASNCQPLETLTGCDATYCTLTAGGGPNGGDLCECTIPAAQHPVADDIETDDAGAGINGCWQNAASSDLLVTFDLGAGGFNAIAATTCTTTPDDSSLAIYDAANVAPGAELACDEDTGPSFCAELDPTFAPAGGVVTVAIDEYSVDDYWDDATDRVIRFELLALEICDNTTDDDGDAAIDCADSDCDGVGFCEAVETTCDDGNDNDGDGDVDCDDANCATAPNCAAPVAPTVPGQLVITEIMQNPAALDDGDGEWFELYNAAAVPLELQGCEIRDLDATSPNTHTIGSSLVVPSGGYVTLATGATPGFAPDYVYGGSWFLANGADEVVVTCGAVDIDSVSYDGGPIFPDPTGASMSLDLGSLDAVSNDTGTNWCPATTASANYTSGDFGSPGQANPACP